MNRIIVLITVAGVLVGLAAGYLWWGAPIRRLQTELGEARQQAEAIEPQLEEARNRAEGLEAELKRLQGRLSEMEEDLRLERQRRSALEGIVSRGRK
jgi:predicted  nucleic acid-binding Zn-ribbon protein